MHLLLEVVSKGGNLALNIAPQPDGMLPAPGVRSLRDLGAWLKLFGKGIYETRICAPCFEDRLFYTQKGNTVYAFYTYDEVPVLPSRLTLHLPQQVRAARSIRTGQSLHLRQSEDGVTLDLQDLAMGGAFYAEGFALEVEE